MARTSAWRSALLAAAVLAAVVGCTENITSPGACPALCPLDEVQLADTLLAAPVVFDTSVRGYVVVREAPFLLLSDLDSLQSVTLLQFPARPSQWYPTASDTAVVGVTDSVILAINVLRRDTAAKPLRVVVHRLPAQFDTAWTYDSVRPYLADSTLVDTALVADTVKSGNSANLNLPVSRQPQLADSGVLSLALTVVADTQTALGIQSGNLGTAAPTLYYYVHGHLLKDPLQLDTIAKTFAGLLPTFATFVMSPDPAQPPSGVLTVGGIPSARATMRLSLPKIVIDSTSIVRATLILNTIRPVQGFAQDSFYVDAFPVLRDYGIKSVTYPDTTVGGHVLLHQGTAGTVGVEITPILRYWGTTAGDSVPRMIVLRSSPEGYGIGSVDFAGAGALAPQLRVTYVKHYHFGVP